MHPFRLLDSFIRLLCFIQSWIGTNRKRIYLYWINTNNWIVTWYIFSTLNWVNIYTYTRTDQIFRENKIMWQNFWMVWWWIYKWYLIIKYWFSNTNFETANVQQCFKISKELNDRLDDDMRRWSRRLIVKKVVR